MKKYYCFYCQKDVEPRHFFKWRFCPHCKHYMTDNGDGFYRVCAFCGANMSVDAAKCVKCGKHIGLPASKTKIFNVNNLPQWVIQLIRIVFSIILIFFVLGILYVSFYLFIAALVIGLAMFLFNLLLPTR